MKKSVPTLNPWAGSPSSAPWSVPHGPFVIFLLRKVRKTHMVLQQASSSRGRVPGRSAPFGRARGASWFPFTVRASSSRWRPPSAALLPAGRGSLSSRFGVCVSAVLSFPSGSVPRERACAAIASAVHRRVRRGLGITE